jgi:hypothetical protein
MHRPRLPDRDEAGGVVQSAVSATPFATITIRVFEGRPPAIETGWAGVDAPEQRDRVVEALAGAERFFRVLVETSSVNRPVAQR